MFKVANIADFFLAVDSALDLRGLGADGIGCISSSLIIKEGTERLQLFIKKYLLSEWL